jgi:shikimate dehydrogenase
MGRTQVVSLIGNREKVNLEQTDYYAGIMGDSPSKGARSPALWNAAFKGLGISAMMHPMDVTAEQLGDLIKALRSDSRFIGGAVAVPYKQDVMQLLDAVEDEAETIGAVNCIYRDGGRLVGTNTDGAGGVQSLMNGLGEHSLKGRRILIMGIGGAGRAVATYVAAGLGPSGGLVLANRTAGVAESLAERLKRYCSVRTSAMPVKVGDLEDKDVIINCSLIGYGSVFSDQTGSYTLEPYTPLGPVDGRTRVAPGEGVKRRFVQEAKGSILKNLEASLDAFQHIREGAFLFDIIHQPAQTTLLRLAECHGMAVLNGVGMNLYQAVIAFQKATGASKIRSGPEKEVWETMLNAGK